MRLGFIWEISSRLRRRNLPLNSPQFNARNLIITHAVIEKNMAPSKQQLIQTVLASIAAAVPLVTQLLQLIITWGINI